MAAAFVTLFWATDYACQTQAAEAPKLGYRLAMRTSAHFDTPKEADANLKTLKQLGCDASKHEHNGHIDVTYRCPQWKSISISHAKEAEQWQGWLRKKGFAVVYHSPAKTHAEKVQYRLTEWKAFHFHDSEQAQAHAELMKMLGCKIKQVKHGNHDDVAVYCPEWQTIGLANHADAHEWETRLKKLGFATVHKH